MKLSFYSVFTLIFFLFVQCTSRKQNIETATSNNASTTSSTPKVDTAKSFKVVKKESPALQPPSERSLNQKPERYVRPQNK